MTTTAKIAAQFKMLLTTNLTLLPKVVVAEANKLLSGKLSVCAHSAGGTPVLRKWPAVEVAGARLVMQEILWLKGDYYT